MCYVGWWKCEYSSRLCDFGQRLTHGDDTGVDIDWLEVGEEILELPSEEEKKVSKLERLYAMFVQTVPPISIKICRYLRVGGVEAEAGSEGTPSSSGKQKKHIHVSPSTPDSAEDISVVGHSRLLLLYYHAALSCPLSKPHGGRLDANDMERRPISGEAATRKPAAGKELLKLDKAKDRENSIGLNSLTKKWNSQILDSITGRRPTPPWGADRRGAVSCGQSSSSSRYRAFS